MAPRNQLETFATATDFVDVLRVVEERFAMSFVVVGVFETKTVTRLESVRELSAIVASGAEALALLAIRKGVGVEVREVARRDGLVRYVVDPLNNPSSVVLRPGGVVGDGVVVAGQIGTSSRDPDSLTLFAAMSRVVRGHFSKVRSYWVGPEALRILDRGGRLAAIVKAPPEYDLKR